MGAPARRLEVLAELPELGGLVMPEPGPARLEAWRELHQVYARKALDWPRVVLEDGASHVTVKALEVVEGHARRVLGIKANPPTYRAMVDDLAGALVTSWGVSEGLVLDAADDIMKTVDRHGRGKVGTERAKRRIDQLQDELAAAGKAVTAGPMADTYTRYLAAAFLLGQTEATKPLGWEASFSLVDQDAIAGLSRSGLFWIGDHYGDALDSGKLLAAAQRAIESGEGRVTGGKLLREAFGAEFHRSDAYWRGLASTVATRSRSFGALSGMEATGATVYEYVNPMDERTSDVCEALDGTRFTVKGGIELRDRLIQTTDPEAWKVISPWPKRGDLDGPDGQLLTPAELQAKGIAWPPMHFHCRSSIDVVTWTEITAEDLDGPFAVERAGPRPPRAAPGKPPPPPPKPPPVVSPWDQAKADLAAAEDRARALGLDPERGGLSEATSRELLSYWSSAKADPLRPKLNTWDRLPPALDGIGSPSTPGPRKAPTHLIERWANLLEGTAEDAEYGTAAAEIRANLRAQALGHWTKPGELERAQDHLAKARAWYTSPTLGPKVRRELDALREVQAAYKRAAELAPPEIREAWRADLVGKLLDGVLPSSWSQAKREAVEAAALESWRTYPVDWLRLYRLEWERVIHDGREDRAYASPGTWGGSITMNLGSLVRESGGSFLPVVGHQPGTLAHELGHRFDGIFGGRGYTGQAWRPRADYPGIDGLWRSTFGDPYQGQWERVKSTGAPKLVKLPHNEPHSKYQYAGTWVRNYEARIYAGGSKKPDLLEIQPFGEAPGGGPIEFIAMAVQYVQEASGQTMLLTLERSAGGRSVESLARCYLKSLTSWDEWQRPQGMSSRRTWAALVRARATYAKGRDYRDGLEAMLGAGRRRIRRLVETNALTFKGDHDVQAFALLVRHVHGTSLEDLVGPRGLLSGYLSAPLEASRLGQLETAAGYLDGLGAADLPDHAWDNLFTLTASPDAFDRGLGELVDLAEDAAP